MPNNRIGISGLKQLLQMGEQLLEFETLDAQRIMILSYIKSILECEVRLFLPELDGQAFATDSSQSQSDQEKPKNQDLLTPLMIKALESKQITTAKSQDFSTASIRRKSSTSKKKPQISSDALFAAAPLIFHEKLLGVLQVSRPDGPSFSPDEILLLGGLATQSVLGIQAQRWLDLARRQTEMLSLVRTVSAQIAEVLDLDELTMRVTRLIQESFQYYYVAIFIQDPGEDVYRFRYGAQPGREVNTSNFNPFLINQKTEKPFSEMFPFEIKPGQGIIGNAAQVGKAVIVNNVTTHNLYRFYEGLNDTKSEAALPLKIDNRILGLLDVQSDHLNAFQETDVLVLQTLADHIATAIENVRLYGDIRRRAEQMEVVAEVSNAITSVLDQEQLLKDVVHLVHRRLGFPFVRIFSVHTGRRKVIFQAGESILGEITDQSEPTFDLDDQEALISWVAREGKARLVNDINLDPLFRSIVSTEFDVHSIFIIPLAFTGDVLGILEVQSDRLHPIDHDDQSLLEALADYIAIAMRNASLYRSETWRRQVADSMREVAGLLTADTALDQVLEVILRELERALPCDVATIWLSNQVVADQDTVDLRLAAVHITQEYIKNHSSNENSLSDKEILELLGRSSLPSPWLLDALISATPKTRSSNDPYEPLGAILDFPLDYSAIAAPLRIAGQPLGLLALVHHTNGRYGHEAQSMTETFASYAAVAIENTRLYETAHDQAWVSTVLLRVAEATQSLNTLEELLTTMVRITPMLIGVNSCTIFLWDSSFDVLTPNATFGLSQEQEQYVNLLRIRLGDIPAFDQLFFSKSPVFIDDLVINPFLKSFKKEQKSLVLFPMVAHGEVLGAFLIDYSYTRTQTRAGKLSEEVDWEEKFAIIQGIAHQAAIAVENIRLIKAQQDEAYVSVALLQVAQAVVSSNTLNEILEAIVRITPILIGVKRSLIFIWDLNRKTYSLLQSYGLTKSELLTIGEEFSEEEFPLLKTVRVSNNIVYHRTTIETESPTSWINIHNQDFDMIDQDISLNFGGERLKAGEDTNLGRDYLKSQASLLYGFPLSVKGNVLGVMLTQEMETTAGFPSRYIREKRLEISIGITQQAAMAIQNDLLQREVVERERLEREFQLARDIQRTFLPSSLPVYPGWELHSLWRPARQVSGDFYDVIELPNNRWGLVIADVADKGMPAALYMTLIRTLIRAAVKDEDSPASVLSRVNDLLVADSKSGMFVTTVYAVLSLDNGKLMYANAGHNHPLIIRQKNARLEKMVGTAMALGIFEGIEIKQKSITLNQGDTLVFYTDGITEAFSPDEEMYGEDRLIESIYQGDLSSARSLAESIDTSVSNFTHDGTPSDDLTMVVLKRLLPQITGEQT